MTGRAEEVPTNQNWESTFSSWGSPPSATEQTKCENAERAIRKAIQASSVLGEKDTSVFAQGSYRNRTNVRTDSDVDICVLCTDTFVFDLPEGVTAEELNLVNPADYQYAEYKDDVHNALVSHFGRDAVTRGNKAFDIHENTYRVDADVVACFEHRRYFLAQSGRYDYLSGTELHPDRGGRIINWPQQNYDNGVRKNTATGRRFKAIVRIMKRLRNEMKEQGIPEAIVVPSYLLECLVWNVPDQGFGRNRLTEDVRFTLAHLYEATCSDDTCGEWGEINELEYLFRGQAWTRQQANAFVYAAWNYIGFE